MRDVHVSGTVQTNHDVIIASACKHELLAHVANADGTMR